MSQQPADKTGRARKRPTCHASQNGRHYKARDLSGHGYIPYCTWCSEFIKTRRKNG